MEKFKHNKTLFAAALLFLLATPAYAGSPKVDKTAADKGRTSRTRTSPRVLLQKAIYAEETEGDLDKAIELYQQTIDRAGRIQPIAAQATYQLAMCYLKKGEKNKAAKYLQLVSNYPTQKAIVAKAKQKLKELKPEKVDSPKASRKIFLPECDTTTFDLLDLPSGGLINSEPGGNIIDTKDPNGMGHLYFDNARGHPYIVGIRGTRLQLRIEGKLFTTRPEFVSYGRNAYYATPSLPCQYQVTTGTGEKYELKVLSVDKTGAKIEYYKIADPKEWVQGLVEDFFKHNYRDITSRKTIEWGNPVTDATGNVSISYKYEMTIWDKDKYLANELFTFDKNGKYLSARKVEGFPKPLGKIVFLPDADDVIQEGKVAVVLDLATGKMLPGNKDKQYFNKLNKGDVAYFDDEGKDILVCFRGAKITRKTANGKYSDTPDHSHTDNTIHIYIINKTPAEWTITTKEGDIYDIKVLSLDNDQAKIKYRKIPAGGKVWAFTPDLSTPEATIKSFVKVVYDGNLAAAKACVSKDGADYDEFKEMLATESNHPFQAMIKAMDASIPVEITSKDITEDRCKIEWHFTLGRVYYIGDTKIKKGTHQKFGSYLKLVGDKWLIRDI